MVIAYCIFAVSQYLIMFRTSDIKIHITFEKNIML